METRAVRYLFSVEEREILPSQQEAETEPEKVSIVAQR
jgi:hypothetical protein